MNRTFFRKLIPICCAISFVLIQSSCKNEKRKTVLDDLKYEAFKDSVIQTDSATSADTSNIFDEETFTPGVDSVDTMLVKMDSVWQRENALIVGLDTLKKGINKLPGYSEAEKAAIRENMQALDSFVAYRNLPDSVNCKGKDCIIYAEIDKSKQRLYLYILGEPKDTFKVSTGIGKYETPDLDLRPSGPILTKYSSRKFPGGNYQGLGNMPYAIFLRGGYAIHGTTTGSFPKLGTKASHGCIRLHPDNAKVFNALVKTVGLQNTWVTIKDSLP